MQRTCWLLLYHSHILKQNLRRRDVTLRIATKDTKVRIVFASTKGLLQETLRRHLLAARTNGDINFLQLIGTHLTFTNILAALQEGEERVAARFTTNKETIITEALALGECRCCVRSDNNNNNNNNNNIIEGIQFPLRVDRVLYGQAQPFSSVTAAELDILIPELMKENDNDTTNYIQRFPEDKLKKYFHYNMTLHGFNFLRKSEGSESALWCCTCLDDPNIQQTLKYYNSPTIINNETNNEIHTKLESALMQGSISHGFLIQPLLAEKEVEANIKKLQQRLISASIKTPEIFYELMQRARELGLACQDTLSLITGDYTGAYTVAIAARQCTQDPNIAAPIIEKIRKEFKVSDFKLLLDSETLIRNGLDFFCRCSKENFMQSVRTLPLEELKDLAKETKSFRCTFCAKEHQIQEEDWKKVLEKYIE